MARTRVPEPRELSRDEWVRLVDRLALRYFGMNADQFAKALKAGEFGDPNNPDRPEAMRIAMLLPNGR